MYLTSVSMLLGVLGIGLYKDNQDISLNRASFSTLSTTLACNEDTSYTPIGVYISALVSAGSVCVCERKLNSIAQCIYCVCALFESRLEIQWNLSYLDTNGAE